MTFPARPSPFPSPAAPTENIGTAFQIEARDAATRARAGILRTAHGAVATPVFMPVATQGTVKALTQADLESLGVRAILANAYHLYLRPGTSIVEKAGGLHRFINYPGCILTDSGGFQGMSLADLRKFDENGIQFKSHLDGSLHELTPEKVMDIQRSLGADIHTTLDVCVRWPVELGEARDALERTMRWTERCRKAFDEANADADPAPLFFPIVQGALFPDLRRRACGHLLSVLHDGVSLGGFSVGEPKPETWEVLSRMAEYLPDEKPRYLMGVGTPEDLWEAVSHGVDMMDCVWPTRVARHGCAMTHAGRLNLMNSGCREDLGPLDPDCACRVCRSCSRAYVSHLFRAQEYTAGQLLSYHNVFFLMEIMGTIRRAIAAGRFSEARAEFFRKYSPDPAA
ncbi:MAG: tRNA guanosine(34) transglycosylase Tgt [Elusimicrobia bacterium]|nr:tRNA guanosine(34) transglycosylase Tgt [Elusimicrobiota bacterium]